MVATSEVEQSPRGVSSDKWYITKKTSEIEFNHYNLSLRDKIKAHSYIK